ncbi:FHOD1 [Cordylochernes scorpioides]|uniref:FHOD1 n=1 Tax=Cordylochernes scorpioides TaxID=51811 RepID=A0ABY6KGI2_9ARAC|nr:FHOD1 [Cordylochernes scorpioides]
MLRTSSQLHGARATQGSLLPQANLPVARSPLHPNTDLPPALPIVVVVQHCTVLFQDDKDLVHEFVQNDGLTCLVNVGSEADQNYQNYILRALGQLMLYVDGMNGVMAHAETVQWLYSLIASKFRLVVKTSLKLLLVFVEYTESNCLLLNAAVRAVDGERGVLDRLRFLPIKKMDQRTCIKFCVKNEIKCADAFRMLTVAYREATLDRSNVYRWYKMLSDGREDVNDEERAGRPSTSTTDEKINEVE